MTTPAIALPVELTVAISLYQGDSRELLFRFFTDDARTVPLDLTGYGSVATGQIRAKPGQPVLAPLDLSGSDLAGGHLVITFTPEWWVTYPAFLRGGFDVQIATEDASTVTTVLLGQLTVRADYTRA